MVHSTAIVKTEHGSRYLQQLCKHWSHKMTVEFDALKGRVEFPSSAQLTLAASASDLTLDLDVEQAEERPRLEAVVEDHIKRFAFRETLEFTWNRQD